MSSIVAMREEWESLEGASLLNGRLRFGSVFCLLGPGPVWKFELIHTLLILGFPGSTVVESAWNAGVQ